MASPSYLERKLRKLNCMKNQQQYGSVDSVDNAESAPKKQFKLFGRFGKKVNKADEFTVSYEHEQADERTQLLASASKKKKKYSNIGEDCDEQAKKSKKPKKNVKFSTADSGEGGRDKRSKKKSGLLKRTGKLIVRTCRLMSYGTPYMTHMAADFPYNTRYPPDYRYYDFETKQYDFGYSNNYMGYNGCSPSVFF